jgi:hypothetical protein
MKRSRVALSGLVGVVATTGFLALTDAGRAVAQSMKPLLVQVVNDSTTPVPVVGTVSGSVTGAVSINGTPTVKIDPTGNAVTVSSSKPAVLLNTGNFTLSGPTFLQVDVSSHAKVRVSFEGGNDVRVDVFSRPDGCASFDCEFQIDSLEGDFPRSHVLDLPGAVLNLAVLTNGGGYPVTARVAVYGI